MNKNDVVLIIGIVAISLISIIIISFFEKSGDKQAIVYYNNSVIKKITLTNNETKKYTVRGYNGDVILVTNNGKIKVDKETSPYHLCSKQGYISKSYETIVCLPNKLVIKIEDKEELDGVVK